MNIKYSTNNQWVGKTVLKVQPNGARWQYYNDTYVDMGHKWVNREESIEQVFHDLSVVGKPIAPYLSCGNRKADNFVSHQVALIDIDSGLTLPELFEHEFYQLFGGGFYTSPSFSDQLHKYRVVFWLENPITDVQQMKYLLTGLIDMFGSDVACKDGCRLFNGTVNARYSDFTGVMLPQTVMNSLITTAAKAAEYTPQTRTDYQPPSDETKQKIIEQLKTIFLGNHDGWLRVGLALRDGGYALEDFVEVTIGGMMSAKTAKQCEVIWKDNHTVSYGYIINLLKQHGKILPSKRDIKALVLSRAVTK